MEGHISSSSGTRSPNTTAGSLLVIFGVAVGINFIWEMAQMPLYKEMPFDALASWWLCFRASLGDGAIVLTVWAIGAAAYRRFYWFRPLTLGNAMILLLSGAAIAVGIEIHAISTGRWAYTGLMPVIPFVDVGLSPVVQLLVLPWLSMVVGARLWRDNET